MIASRRMLLCAGVGATAAFAARSGGAVNAPRAQSCAGPAVDGAFDCAADARAAAARDFGHILRKEPLGVLRPTSVADIAHAIEWAGNQGLKIAPRGQGHSTYGRAMAEGGVVVDMRGFNTIHSVEPDRIAVDAGATWSSVLDATLARGLTPPVLTNYLALSVGGTIAVGGVGTTSSRQGMQTDHVLELNVVTGEGRELTCSAGTNPDLFDAARAGLGQCGIVTRAVLRLVRAPQRVRRYQLFYQDLQALSTDQRRVLSEQRFDQLQGAVLPDANGGWRYQLEAALYYDDAALPDDKSLLATLSDERGAAVITDATYRDDIQAFAKFEALLRQNGHWSNPQPWLFTFLRGGDAEQFAGGLLAGLTAADIGRFGRVIYYPLETSAFGTPLARLPADNIAFAFNLVRIPGSNDEAKISQMVAQNRALYDRIRAAGGVQYPVGAFALSPADWKDHFAAKWTLLRDAKRRHDPRNLLTPGYEVF